MIFPLLLFACSYAQGPGNISVPLGTYSYPEIAALLSTDSFRVDAALAVKERGALIGLQSRPRDEALSLVCRSLDLVAEQVGPGHIRLRPDPKVDLREKKWRTGLLESLLQRWKNLRGTMRALGELSPAQIQSRADKLASRPLAEQAPEWPALQMMLQFPSYAKAGQVIADSINTPLPQDLLSTSFGRNEIQVDIPPELVKQIQSHVKSFGGSPLRNPMMLQWVFERTPGQLSLRSDFFSSEETGLWSSLPSPVHLLKVSMSSPEHARALFSDLTNGDKATSVPGLGEDAPPYLASSEEATAKAAREPGADENFPIPNYENALSAVVQRWAEKNHRDVVMELAPIGEALNASERRGIDATATTNFSLQKSVLADDSWGMDLAGDVLIVRNRMAFLDHVSDCPVGSIAHFLRTCGGRACPPDGIDLDRVDNSPGLPRFDDLMPLLKARFGSGAESRTWFGSSGYRSGLSDAFLAGRPALLWPGLPRASRKRISETEQGDMNLRLVDYDAASLNALISSCLTGDNGEERRAEVADAIRKATLSIRWRRVEGGEVSIRLRLTHLREGITYNLASAFRIPQTP